MSFLVGVTGVAVVFWGIIILGTVMSNPPAGLVVFTLIIEAGLVLLFLEFRKKYKSPEYQEKIRKAQEDRFVYKATAPARKKQKEELREWRNDIRKQSVTVVSTRLIGEGSPVYKKSVGDMVIRGAVGSIFGPVGAAVGMATAKSKSKNKNKRRFLVKYQDGHIEEMEVKVGGMLYRHYMEHLEWEDQK